MENTHNLFSRVENIVNLYKNCKDENLKLKEGKILYASMKVSEKFPTLDGAQRLTKENVRIGDIIRCLVLKVPLYAVVNRITNSGVCVDDLCMTMNGITLEFHRKSSVNITHKGSLNFVRKIVLINRDEYIIL